MKPSHYSHLLHTAFSQVNRIVCSILLPCDYRHLSTYCCCGAFAIVCVLDCLPINAYVTPLSHSQPLHHSLTHGERSTDLHNVSSCLTALTAIELHFHKPRLLTRQHSVKTIGAIFSFSNYLSSSRFRAIDRFFYKKSHRPSPGGGYCDRKVKIAIKHSPGYHDNLAHRIGHRQLSRFIRKFSTLPIGYAVASFTRCNRTARFFLF